MVALESGISLPDGTEVTVIVPAAPEPVKDKMSDEERRRVLQILDRIAALPDENPGDTFSGADHDKVLYGEP